MKTTQIKWVGITLTSFWRCAVIQTGAAPEAGIFVTALVRAQKKTLGLHIEQRHLA